MDFDADSFRDEAVLSYPLGGYVSLKPLDSGFRRNDGEVEYDPARFVIPAQAGIRERAAGMRDKCAFSPACSLTAGVENVIPLASSFLRKPESRKGKPGCGTNARFHVLAA